MLSDLIAASCALRPAVILLRKSERLAIGDSAVYKHLRLIKR